MARFAAAVVTLLALLGMQVSPQGDGSAEMAPRATVSREPGGPGSAHLALISFQTMYGRPIWPRAGSGLWVGAGARALAPSRAAGPPACDVLPCCVLASWMHARAD